MDRETALLYLPTAKSFGTTTGEYVGVLNGITEAKHTYSPPGRYKIKTDGTTTTRKLIDDSDEMSIEYQRDGSLVDVMDLNYIIYIYTPVYGKKQGYRIKSITRNDDKTYKIIAEHIKYDLKKVNLPYYPRHASDYDKYSEDMQKAYYPVNSSTNVKTTGPETFRKIFSSNANDRKIQVKVYTSRNNYVYAYYSTDKYNLPNYSFYSGFTFKSEVNSGMGLFGNAVGPAFASSYSYSTKVTGGVLPADTGYNLLDIPEYCVGMMTRGFSLYEELLLDTPEGCVLDFDNFNVTLYSMEKYKSKCNGYGHWADTVSNTVRLTIGHDISKYNYAKSLSTDTYSGTLFMGKPEIGTYYINRVPYDNYGEVVAADPNTVIDTTSWTKDQLRYYGIKHIEEIETDKSFTADSYYASVVLDENNYSPYVARYELVDLGTIRNVTQQYTHDTVIGNWAWGEDVPFTWIYAGKIDGYTGMVKSNKDWEWYSDGPKWVENEDGLTVYETGEYGWYTDEQLEELGEAQNATHADALKISARIDIDDCGITVQPGDVIILVDPVKGINLSGTATQTITDCIRMCTETVEIGDDMYVVDNFADTINTRKMDEYKKNYEYFTKIIKEWEACHCCYVSVDKLTTHDGKQIKGLIGMPSELIYPTVQKESNSLALYLEDNPNINIDEAGEYLRDIVLSSFELDESIRYGYLTELFQNGHIFTNYEKAKEILDNSILPENVQTYILSLLTVSDPDNSYMNDINPLEIMDPVTMALYYGSATSPDVRRYIDRSDMIGYLSGKYFTEVKKLITYFDGSPTGRIMATIIANPEKYYSLTDTKLGSEISKQTGLSFSKVNSEVRAVIRAFLDEIKECDTVLYSDTTPTFKEFYARLEKHYQSRSVQLPARYGGYPILIDTECNFKYWRNAAYPKKYNQADDSYDIPLLSEFSVTPGWTTYPQTAETELGTFKNLWLVRANDLGERTAKISSGAFSEKTILNTDSVKVYHNDGQFPNHSFSQQYKKSKLLDCDICAFWWSTFYYGFQDVIDYYENDANLARMMAARPIGNDYFGWYSSIDKFVPKSFIDFYLYPLRNFALACEYEDVKVGITLSQKSACSDTAIRAMRTREYDIYGVYPKQSICANIVNMMCSLYTDFGQEEPEHAIVNPSDVSPSNIFEWYDKYWLANVVDGRNWLRTKHNVSAQTTPNLSAAYDMLGQHYTYWTYIPIHTKGGLDKQIMTIDSTEYDPTQKYIFDVRTLPFTDSPTKLQKMQLLESAFELNWLFARDNLTPLDYRNDPGTHPEHYTLFSFLIGDPDYMLKDYINNRQHVINSSLRNNGRNWNANIKDIYNLPHQEMEVTVPMYLWARYGFYNYWNNTQNGTFHNVINSPLQNYRNYLTLSACESLYTTAGLDPDDAIDLYYAMRDVNDYIERLHTHGDLRLIAEYLGYCNDTTKPFGKMTVEQFKALHAFHQLRNNYTTMGYHYGRSYGYFDTDKVYGPDYYSEGTPVREAYSKCLNAYNYLWTEWNKRKDAGPSWSATTLESMLRSLKYDWSYNAMEQEWESRKYTPNYWNGYTDERSAGSYVKPFDWGYWCLPNSVLPPIPWEETIDISVNDPHSDHINHFKNFLYDCFKAMYEDEIFVHGIPGDPNY